MSTILISHSSKDNLVAAEVNRRLEMQGHRSVFLDFNPEEGIPAGRNWERELYRQLRSGQALIVFCSEHSISSCWCFAEITHAKSPGKRVFPITVGPCVIDPVLSSQQIITLARNSEVSKPDDTYNQIRCNLVSEHCSSKGSLNLILRGSQSSRRFFSRRVKFRRSPHHGQVCPNLITGRLGRTSIKIAS